MPARPMELTGVVQIGPVSRLNSVCLIRPCELDLQLDFWEVPHATARCAGPLGPFEALSSKESVWPR